MNDEELLKTRRALETYNAQLENMNRQLGILRATRDETYLAGRALDAIAGAEKGEEVLVPVGASAYVRVVVTGKDAVTGIGQGILIERDPADAAKKMDEDRAEIEAAIGETVKTVQEIQGYIRDLSATFQQEIRQRNAAARPQ